MLNRRMGESFNLRNTLIAVIVGLLVIVGNLKWQDSLRTELHEKQDELQDAMRLTNSKSELGSRQNEIEAFKAASAGANQDAWKDALPTIVAAQKLILRQVRPLGIEGRGKIKEERVLIQVEGDMNGIVGFLHATAASDLPIYVGQVSIGSEKPGSGFITAEIVIAKPILE